MTIDHIRSICAALPAVTEDVKWDNDLVLSVGGKMFCVASLDPPFRYSFKVRDEEYEELSVRSGFKPAPYMARARWVQVTDPHSLHRQEAEAYLRQSYELVRARLTRKQRTELGI